MPLSAVLVFCKVLGVPLLQGCEIFIDLDALLEIGSHLVAFRNLICSLYSIVINALDECSFVGKAWQFVVGLDESNDTLY